MIFRDTDQEFDAAAVRDELVRALASAGPSGLPEAFLVDAQEGLAELWFPGTRDILVLVAHRPVIDTPAILFRRIAALAARKLAGKQQIVVIGGDEPERDVLARVPHNTNVTLQHLDAAMRIFPVSGAIRDTVQRAVEHVVPARAAALTPIERAEFLAATQRADKQLRSFFTQIQATRPIATWAIAAFCAVVYALEVIWEAGPGDAAIWRMGAGNGAAVLAGDWWRLVTQMTLHGSGTHLAMNMMALVSLGPFIESLVGKGRFLILFVLCGIAGAAGSALVHPATLSVGASGAIWGLMTATLGLVLRPGKVLPAIAVASMRKRIWMPVLLNAALSFLPNIDWVAHFAGGAVGLGLMASGLLTSALTKPVMHESAEERGRFELTTLVAALLVGLVGVAVAVAWGVGRPWELGGTPTLETVRVGGTSLSLDIPVGWEKATDESVGTEQRTTWGSVTSTLMLVSVAHWPAPQGSPRDRLAVAEQELADRKDTDSTVVEPAARIVIGTRPVVRMTEQFKSGVQLSRFWIEGGANTWLVDVALVPGAGNGWKQAVSRVAASVRLGDDEPGAGE